MSVHGILNISRSKHPMFTKNGMQVNNTYIHLFCFILFILRPTVVGEKTGQSLGSFSKNVKLERQLSTTFSA